jgi:UDP-N-acetylmuramoylalanine--D-glutamate ligase
MLDLNDGTIYMGNDSVLVFGLNRSGLGAVKLLSALGTKTLLWDDNEEVRKTFPLSSGVSFLQGGMDMAYEEGVRLAVVSPGITPDSSGITSLRKQGISIISEVELAYRHCKAPIVAITGTNGKSSAVTILHTLLDHEGYSSRLVGNIGIPFSSVVADVILDEILNPDWYVLEVSSYQLAMSNTLKPKIAVYTSYAPDHLDWHGHEQAYVEAKVSMARRLGEGDSIVFPESSGILGESLIKICKETSASVVLLRDKYDGQATNPDFDGAVDIAHRGNGINPHVVEMGSDSGELTYMGQFYNFYKLLKDAAFAPSLVSCALQATLGVAAAMGMNMNSIVNGLMNFVPLEHRLEDIGTVGSVRFINDSKATNIDATSYALKMCYGPVILLLGGRDKGVSYRELLPFMTQSLKMVVAYGEASKKIVADLTGEVPLKEARCFLDALAMASKEASFLTLPSGGAKPIVLLSPACSSFDEFKNFEERGFAFKRWVRKLREDTLHLLKDDDGKISIIDTSSGSDKDNGGSP